MRQLEDAVDIVHRIGRKEDNRNARRLINEEILRSRKDSPVCKERGIRFSETLPLEDREARKNLWPARSEGKRAYFRGPHGYVKGRKIGSE